MMFIINLLYKILTFFFNRTPLIVAAQKGNAEIVQLLLSCKNIDVNIPRV